MSMPYKLSPSSLSLLSDCPRCFWLQLNKGVKRPEGIFPSLPSGIDRILKDHFDRYAEKNFRKYAATQGFTAHTLQISLDRIIYIERNISNKSYNKIIKEKNIGYLYTMSCYAAMPCTAHVSACSAIVCGCLYVCFASV